MAASGGDLRTASDLGVLVVGHGTRDPVGQAQTRSLACHTAGQLAPLATEMGFLELATPTIADGVASLAAAGVRRLITVPVLLFRAGHADRDIPEAVAAAANEHGIQVLHQTAPLEHQHAVVKLSAERFTEAINAAGCGDAPADQIALALIARGSSSDSAANAMLEFARLRVNITPVNEHRVGYVAVRQPDVLKTLDWLAGTSAQVLVVQPHLLFEGEVFHSLEDEVDQRRKRDQLATAHNSTRQRRWVVCKPLSSAAEDLEDTRLSEVLAGLVRQHVS